MAINLFEFLALPAHLYLKALAWLLDIEFVWERLDADEYDDDFDPDDDEDLTPA